MEVVASVLSQIVTAFHPEIIGEFINGYTMVFGLMILGFILHFMPVKIEKITENAVVSSPFPLKVLYLSLIIFIVIQVKSAEIQPFIYFQF